MIEVKNMTIEELEARRSEIAEEINAGAFEDIESLEARTAELDSIKEELEARKALEAAKVEAREKVAQGEGTVIAEFKEKEERKMFEVNSVEYRNAWIKSLQGKELTAEERTGYTQTGASATNAIPTLIADKMFEKMKKLAPMLSEITLLHAAGNIQFVVEGTRNTASKHTENAQISVSADTTVAVTLGAYEFYKIIGISESAKVMSVDSFETWLIEMLAGDIARAIDNYILNDATNGLAALCGTSSANQIVNTATTGYTYKNICSLIGLLPAAYDAEAKFLVNKKTLYGQIAAITDNNGRPIFVQNREGGIGGMIMGYPVIVDDYVTTANDAIYLGKFLDIVGNMSQDINVITYPDYDYAQVKFRGGAIFDSKLAKNDAIVRLVSTTA